MSQIWPSQPIRSAAANPNVGVLVRNLSDAPSYVIQRAEAECERVFQAAGIQVSWINASADVNWTGPDLVLRAAILPEAPRSRFIESFGSALPKINDGFQLFVYYDRVLGLSRRGELLEHLILAAGLTHEIGHMLLRSSKHSVAGVMKGEWGIRDVEALGQGLLGFTSQQKRQMMGNLQNRSAHAGNRGSGRLNRDQQFRESTQYAAPDHGTAGTVASVPLPDRS